MKQYPTTTFSFITNVLLSQTAQDDTSFGHVDSACALQHQTIRLKLPA
jgi:hypothetical protein